MDVGVDGAGDGGAGGKSDAGGCGILGCLGNGDVVGAEVHIDVCGRRLRLHGAVEVDGSAAELRGEVADGDGTVGHVVCEVVLHRNGEAEFHATDFGFLDVGLTVGCDFDAVAVDFGFACQDSVGAGCGRRIE